MIVNPFNLKWKRKTSSDKPVQRIAKDLNISKREAREIVHSSD